MKLGYATATQTDGWYLISSEPDVTIRVHHGMHVGEDDSGELSLRPTTAMVEFNLTDDGGLDVHVASDDLALQTSDKDLLDVVHLGPRTPSRLNLLNATLTVDTDISANGERDETIDIRLVCTEPVASEAPATTETLEIPVVHDALEVPLISDAIEIALAKKALEDQMNLDATEDLVIAEAAEDLVIAEDAEGLLIAEAAQDPVTPQAAEDPVIPVARGKVATAVASLRPAATLAVLATVSTFENFRRILTNISPATVFAGMLVAIAAIGADPINYAPVAAPAAPTSLAVEQAVPPASPPQPTNEVADVVQTDPVEKADLTSDEPVAEITPKVIPEPLAASSTADPEDAVSEPPAELALDSSTPAAAPAAEEETRLESAATEETLTEEVGSLVAQPQSLDEASPVPENEVATTNPESAINEAELAAAESLAQPDVTQIPVTEANTLSNIQPEARPAEPVALAFLQQSQTPIDAPLATPLPTPLATPEPEGPPRLYPFSSLTVLRQPAPAYPRTRRVRDATVDLEMSITESGAVSDIQVQGEAPAIFVRAAQRAVRKWRFEPVRRDGQAVRVRTSVRISFRDQAGNS